MGWARDILTLWAGPTWSQGALGLSPVSLAIRAGLGATCLGSWESDGAFNAWVPLRKNKGSWV